MTLAYLAALIVAAAGVAAIDARLRLALFHDARRALATVAITAVAMLLIDVAGIATGNFRLGASPWMTGIEVAPHLPLEELVFVVFLAYVSLVALTGSQRLLAARSVRREGEEAA